MAADAPNVAADRTGVKSAEERWLRVPVAEYADIAEVSTEGRIRTLDRVNAAGQRVPGRILKGGRTQNRLIVTLTRDGRSRNFYVSDLVLRAFVGERPSPEHTIRYRNNDKLDSRLSNLYYSAERSKPKVLAPKADEHTRDFIIRNDGVFTRTALANFTGLSQRAVAAILSQHKEQKAR